MTLATVADYELLTGIDVPTDDEPRVQAMLDVASAAIQGATGQTIERARTLAEVVIVETPAAALLLAEGPVYEASPDDEVVVRIADEVVPRDHYSVLADSAMLKHCDCHAWWSGCYEVDYLPRIRPGPGGPRRARLRIRGARPRARADGHLGAVGRVVVRDLSRGRRDGRARRHRRIRRRPLLAREGCLMLAALNGTDWLWLAVAVLAAVVVTFILARR